MKNQNAGEHDNTLKGLESRADRKLSENLKMIEFTIPENGFKFDQLSFELLDIKNLVAQYFDSNCTEYSYHIMYSRRNGRNIILFEMFKIYPSGEDPKIVYYDKKYANTQYSRNAAFLSDHVFMSNKKEEFIEKAFALMVALGIKKEFSQTIINL